MTSSDSLPPLVSGQEKVTAEHLHRRAYVYIRQSSLGQVMYNTESQVNQRRMADRAAGLGWHADQIRLISADQALSASEASQRTGFQELVAQVSLGCVGIIFGYEVSRLARNNSDWYRLLDLAAVFNTLIADYDGIYDLRLFNDRLLLGLKGTMSEAELHLLRLRMQEGRMRKIERGEYRLSLPTGLVRLENGSVVKDPDDQVRHTLELLFTKFDELGSTYKVVRYLHEAGIRLPRRQTSGLKNGQLVWKRPTQPMVYSILINPAYAGAFAYGRRRLVPARRQAGHPRSGVVRKPIEEWIHLKQDVYSAYTSWQQYLTNQQRMRQNARRFNESIQPQGAPRQGAALLQGLARCGTCGHHLWVAYKASPRYVCYGLSALSATPRCGSFHGPTVDAAAVQAFFEAIQPAQLNALESILTEQHAERARQLRYWQEQLKRAEYEAHLAQRRYDAVDPDNRLVAAELERRWEEKLVELNEVQEAYARCQQTTPPSLSAELHDQLRHISDALPQLWESGQLGNEHKKALLRSLITRVVLTRHSADTIAVRIVWVSGHHSLVYVHPPIFRTCDVTRYKEMVGRLQELWQKGLTDTQVAEQLTAEGFRSARSTTVSPRVVQKIRLDQGWQRTRPQNQALQEVDGRLTIRGLARRLGVNRDWVYYRICSGAIDSRYLTRHPLRDLILIENAPELMVQLQQQLEHKPHTNGGI
jgi:DNA invertase Pin-like site-specific DNA recombinase